MVSGQFQAFENPDPDTAEAVPYLVVLQSDKYAHPTVVVAPLIPEAQAGRLGRLRPRFQIGPKVFSIDILQIGAMPRAFIGPPVAELDRYKVIDAYDALISGSWS